MLTNLFHRRPRPLPLTGPNPGPSDAPRILGIVREVLRSGCTIECFGVAFVPAVGHAYLQQAVYDQRQRAAADRDVMRHVVAAWTDPGPWTGHHNRQARRLRDEWPILARALDALATYQAPGTPPDLPGLR